MEKIKLYRFCSDEEANLLLSGEIHTNHTDHYHDGKGGSISRGFCLTADKPAIAWQYLKGIVTPGVCCEYEIPVCFLKKSCGKYAGRITETEKGTQIESVFKDEWCTVMLRPEWLREVIPLETFVPDYELATARWFEANKDKIKYRIGL